MTGERIRDFDRFVQQHLDADTRSAAWSVLLTACLLLLLAGVLLATWVW